jgi:hypothetical protein
MVAAPTYRPISGQSGILEIQETEAAIVRRIFKGYAAGKSPRDIAAALNRERIPGPRGGPWNASTIGGSRKRGNGILQNELYNGRIVWNRQRFVKDPETSRRVSRPNPQSEWMAADAPQLRIVDEGNLGGGAMPASRTRGRASASGDATAPLAVRFTEMRKMRVGLHRLREG